MTLLLVYWLQQNTKYSLYRNWCWVSITNWYHTLFT